MTPAVGYRAIRPTAADRPAVLARRHVDRWLLGATLALAGLGVVMVFDAGFFVGEDRLGDPYALIRRQLVFGFLAASTAAVVARFDARLLRRVAYPLLGATFVMLVLVLIPGIGEVRGGARRWLSLGFVDFEPSELLKAAMVIYLAHSIAKKRERMSSFAFGVLPHLAVLGGACVLLLLQPDFGAAAVLSLLTLAMLFVGGASVAHLGALGGGLALAGLTLIISSPYRTDRVLAFLDPWADPQGKGFQLVQSFLAFGGGGFFGTGLGSGNQKLFYLPEAHTDFVFALIGEELGFIGATTVLVGFAIIAVRGFRVAALLDDPFSRLLAFGLTFTVVSQAAMNVAVVVGALPTKGLPLPLVSYGGSSLLATSAMLATLLALSRETP